MLDQNTDRMWYVIGAVLIGAAIIFGFNSLMPNTFASVGDSMGSVLSTIEYNVGERHTLHSFNAGDKTLSIRALHGADITNFTGSGVNTSFDMATYTHEHDGLHIKPTIDKEGLNKWNPEERYKLSYTMTVKDGDLHRIQHDVRDKGVEVEGRKMIINGQEYGLEQTVDVDLLGDVLHVELYFQPTNEVRDYSDRIAVYPNRADRGTEAIPVEVNISNLRIEVE